MRARIRPSLYNYVRKRAIWSSGNIIVQRKLRLAEGIASRFAGRGVEYEDLLQVASMALIGAIERFEPARGFKFSTFAAPTIPSERSRIISAIRRA